MPAAIRTLIVSGEAPTRAALGLFLRSADGIEVAGEAASGGDGVRMAAELAPDVVVIDARLADLHGMEVARQIVEQAEHPPPRVLLLTAGEDDEPAYRSMQTPIDGYLPKSFAAPEELIQAVKQVASADGQVADRPTPPSGHRPGLHHLRDRLTDRELGVLRLMARGMSNREIANELFVSLETVRTHAKHVYAKCAARNRTEAVLAAYSSGLVASPRGRPRRDEAP